MDTLTTILLVTDVTLVTGLCVYAVERLTARILARRRVRLAAVAATRRYWTSQGWYYSQDK